ncbi:MAG: hypothetical protein COW71_02830 [Ignavibacteriales bacterium CG18_big_fil_WC_8_21_14_2_50_31_20]|nr:MAG: hypothetical protein COW71_02830 [Ignavibacteriales bacterium CG18_big_fil_WC_8_21_14_2_50_31_20]
MVNKTRVIFKYIIIQIILPIVIGITIYVFFREPTKYILNSWFKNEYLNTNYHVLAKFSPSWIKYNLPDALWGYALISSMIIIWNKRQRNELLFWIIFSFVIGIAFEFLQFFKIIWGTFDLKDVVSIVLGMSISLFVNLKKREEIL